MSHAVFWQLKRTVQSLSALSQVLLAGREVIYKHGRPSGSATTHFIRLYLHLLKRMNNILNDDRRRHSFPCRQSLID